MRKPHRFRRPSPAMVVAVLALVVALGGSAYAVRQINGATIRPRSVPADRIRRNALTGTEINEATLRRVNEARNATNSKFALRASVAESAANALNAGSALTAGNASALGGSPPAAYQGRIRWALVSPTGSVLDQSGGFGAVTHTLATGLYVIDFGSSLAGKALFVTPNGSSTSAAAAAPCGGALPGSVACVPSGVNDANHARVQLDAQSPFYIAAIG